MIASILPRISGLYCVLVGTVFSRFRLQPRKLLLFLAQFTMSSSPPRPSKRPRVETVDVDSGQAEAVNSSNNVDDEIYDGEALMMQMMARGTGGDEETRRRERERKRRERQLKMQQKESVKVPIKQEMQQTTSTQAVVKEEVMEIEEKQASAGAQADDDEAKGDDDEDDFDMFSSSVSPVTATTAKTAGATATATTKVDDFQDAEGYYKASIGETLELVGETFKVLGVVGKGVFSTVLKCSTSESSTLPGTVALKFIRHNETMSRAAENEVAFLKKLSHPHIVKLELPTPQHPHLLEHRGHVVMVFSYQPYNLRDVLQKFGKGVGLSLTAVKSYFLQLLSALRHLEKYRIIHADIKPDNVLVSPDFSTVQFCDFGSAMEVGSADAIPTPYLVSRFYRAPEVILGAIPTPALDLWSVGVTVVELFLGQVLFHGKSNNNMIRTFMESMGPFSAKTLRQHLVHVNKLGIPAHFVLNQQNYLYLQDTSQMVNGKHVVKEIQLQSPNFPAVPLQQRLLKAKSAKDPRLHVQHFGNLMQRVLCLEATRRISVADAMKHEFFTATSSTTSTIS
jgi:serine/threonine-protein kinase PRP4